MNECDGRLSPVMVAGGMRSEFVRLRARLGTQHEVAELLDRSVGWVWGLEQGRVPVPRYAIYALRYLLAMDSRVDPMDVRAAEKA